MASIVTVYKNNENAFNGMDLKPTSRYAFQVAFPDSLDQKETNPTLVLWAHGSYSHMKYPEIIKRTKMDEFDYIAEFCDKYNVIAVMPALPRTDGSRTEPPLDTQILSYFTMIHNFDDFYYRPDLEILEFLGQLKNTLRLNGYTISDKYVAGGISAGASVSERIAFLHPNKFSAIAVMCAGVFSYTLDNMDAVDLPYPFGAHKIEEITKEYDKALYDKIRRYIYVGEFETDHAHDSLRYETSHDSKLWENITLIFGDNPYDRTIHYHEFLEKNGIEHKFIIGKGLGHKVEKNVMEEAFNFLIQS